PVADRRIRVALPSAGATIGGTRDFSWLESDGVAVVARAHTGEQWSVGYDGAGRRMRAVRSGGQELAWQRGLVARAQDNGVLTYNGKRYRGDLAFVAQDTGLVVINRLGIEDYLRGVVPVEMGTRPRSDTAALQAQAVASRSYAYVRGMDASGVFDVRASTVDQAYGGVEVENDLANSAIDATRGLVLTYQGRPVDAPYHSTCGGTTAEPAEIWRAAGAPYLKSVSDRIGSGDRYYCDIAPRFRWTRTLTAEQLNDALDQSLKA